MGRRRRVGHTEEWALIEPLLPWREQRAYELLRLIVLFGDTPTERAEQTGAAARTLHEKARRFDEEGVPSLFRTARGPTLQPEIRRLIVDLKVQHPPLGLGEIARICYVQFGRKPSKNTVKAVLRKEPAPLFAERHFPAYHEMSEGRERRSAVVRLHGEGWTPSAIASYLKTSRQSVYSVLSRWVQEGESGLSDKPLGRPKGVSKVDLRAMREVRKLQENPELGEFPIHASLARMGIDLSPRTCGRILAVNRKLYGLGKPKRGAKEKKEMPFQSRRRHEIWSVDIRYIDHHLPEGELPEGLGKVYAINTTQDTTAYLSVLYTAIERYGSPEVLLSDGGSIFRANQARVVYRSLGITKEEIERRRPWQNFIETTFNIQRTMADYYFARAESWEEVVGAHDGWVENYNTQKHWAHREERRPSESCGGSGNSQRRPPQAGGSQEGLLFDEVRPRPRRLGLRQAQALEDLCRGRARPQRGRPVAGGGEPLGRVRWGHPRPLRRRVLRAVEPAAGSGEAASVRDGPPENPGAAKIVRARGTRRYRMAEGPEKGGIRAPQSPKTASPAAGAGLLHHKAV
jgi:putative transposase